MPLVVIDLRRPTVPQERRAYPWPAPWLPARERLPEPERSASGATAARTCAPWLPPPWLPRSRPTEALPDIPAGPDLHRPAWLPAATIAAWPGPNQAPDRGAPERGRPQEATPDLRRLFPWPTPPPPPLPTILTMNLVSVDPRVDPRSRRHEQLVADILNALMRGGQLIQTGPKDWKVMP